MGAWGVGIFADDVACDVRDAYRELLQERLTGPKATRRLLSDFHDVQRDYDDGPVFWLALAATQWKLGRLEPRVKTKALTLIEKGTALKRWLERSEGAGAKRREAVLNKLRTQLLSPQPAEKKIRRQPARFVDTFEWPVGGIFAYRLKSGKFVLFLVVDRQSYVPGGYSTIFTLLDWCGRRLPSTKVIKSLSIVKEKYWLDPSKTVPYLLDISRSCEAEPDPSRVVWLKVRRPPKKDKLLAQCFQFRSEHITGDYGIASWGPEKNLPELQIDVRLANEFGWK